MISVVLYGRNDPYGYNLHKRAVISLNAIAAVLTHADDEIIFVDYNTPDDNPTFIEAIADTLSPECRKMLRVIRVRPDFHQQQFAAHTHLNALEPISRNIAVRRSNPNNRWILSTNTDMVFTPLNGATSLSDICADLPKKLYEIPRFEVPESMWESMDRTNGPGLVRQMYEWSRDLHLHEIVTSYREIVYDGPGDFQLIPRDDLFKIHGFEERMILGWHVDSNLCKRFYMLYGETGSLVDKVYGYHCDHTRVASTMHKAHAPQNRWRHFVSTLMRPDIPEQAENWGFPKVEFEEFGADVSPTQQYLPVLKNILKDRPGGLYEQSYTTKYFNKVEQVPEHVLPYLATLLSPLRRDATCGYIGIDPKMFSLFAQLWKHFGFTSEIFLLQTTHDLMPLQCASEAALGYSPTIMALNDLDEKADLLIFDIGDLNQQDYSGRTHALVWQRDIALYLKTFARGEQKNLLQGKSRNRKYIALNAIATVLEPLTDKYLAATKTPFSSHVRHGYVVPPPAQQAAI